MSTKNTCCKDCAWYMNSKKTYRTGREYGFCRRASMWGDGRLAGSSCYAATEFELSFVYENAPSCPNFHSAKAKENKP